MSNQESAKRVLQEGKDAKDSGGLASRPVATPARSLDAIIQKLKPVPAGEPKEPNPEPAQLARDVPSGTPSAAAAPASDEQKINSTTHKKEYMRLAPCLHCTLVWLVGLPVAGQAIDRVHCKQLRNESLSRDSSRPTPPCISWPMGL